MAEDRFSNFYRVDFKASAEVGGVEVPIVFFDIGYKVDSLPTATIELAYGRNATKGGVSKAQGVLSTLKPFTTLKIYVTTTAADGRAAPPGKKSGLKGGKTLVFDGFVQVPSYSRSPSSQGLTIAGIGKSARLAGSTQFVQGVTTSSPTSGAGQLTISSGNVGKASTNLYSMLLNLNIESDVWAAGIKPLMKDAANQISSWTQESNTFALDAVNRINNGPLLKPSLDLTGLTGTAVPKSAFRRGLAVTLGNTFYNGWAQLGASGNLWNALIALRNKFFYRFLPIIEEDALMPLVWNLGGDEFVFIEPSEYNMFRRNEMPGRDQYSYITRVALYTKHFQTGDFQDSSARTTQLGFSEVAGTLLDGQGQLQLYEAPIWLLPLEASGACALNLGSALPDAANPGAQISSNACVQGDIETEYFSAPLGNAVAKLLLHDNIFFHRRALIGGRFRLDIAPGSLIKVKTAGERFAGKSEILFAHVYETRLQGGTKGQNSFATTLLTLIGVRSEEEHTTISSSEENGVLVHPVYEESTFRGAPLLNGLE